MRSAAQESLNRYCICNSFLDLELLSGHASIKPRASASSYFTQNAVWVNICGNICRRWHSVFLPWVGASVPRHCRPSEAVQTLTRSRVLVAALIWGRLARLTGLDRLTLEFFNGIFLVGAISFNGSPCLISPATAWSVVLMALSIQIKLSYFGEGHLQMSISDGLLQPGTQVERDCSHRS